MDQSQQVCPIDIHFEQEEQGWRAADLMPGEGCVYQGEVYIKLGFSTVELHTYDEHRMSPGTAGEGKRKHFFFHVNDSSVTTIVGNESVTPAKISVNVKIIKLEGSTIFDTTCGKSSKVVMESLVEGEEVLDAV